MLQLKNIVKIYGSGSGAVPALRGVNLCFRPSEFVSILGHSGCGKTTLLNVIGGLDHYTSGDLVINGRSTKRFKDADWDAYRNHSVGFVFQSYNLIPHQSVLANVELALTLSGVSRQERRKRAQEALEKVGLGDQLHKKPNQMSGGQMQRVAIARALVNNPDILLADEPTGALDSATSLQIMDLLKEVAKDRLVIMVTHNPELAETYSTRIIRLLDGEVVGDSHPYTEEEAEKDAANLPAPPQKSKKERTSMSFWTALSLSFHNLMTKKARTFLTSFAGSIGIIGIALILSVSTGVNAYINSVQEDTLSSYPITLKAETTDMSGLLISLMGASESKTTAHDDGAVYSNVVMYQLMDSFLGAEKRTTDLRGFVDYMNAHPETFAEYTSAVQYQYDVAFDVYTTDGDGKSILVDAGEVFRAALGDVSASSMMSAYSSMMTSASAMDVWTELIPGKADESGNRATVSPILTEQYTLRYGKWPSAKDEVVLIVNERNELSDMALYALGLKDRTELSGMMAAILAQEEETEIQEESWPFSAFASIPLSLVLPTDYYAQSGVTAEGKRLYTKTDDADLVASGGLPLKITGIVAPAEGTEGGALDGAIGYTYLLTEYVLNEVANSEIVAYQSLPENENYDVLTGLPFVITEENEKTDQEKKAAFLSYVDALTDEEKYALLVAMRTAMPESACQTATDAQMATFLAAGATMENPTWDRAKMENAVRTSLAESGADTSSAFLEQYIAGLSDDKLAAMIRTSVESMVKEYYAAGQLAALEAELDDMTEADLASYKAQRNAQIAGAALVTGVTERQLKIAALTAGREKVTDLSAAAFYTYLSAADDARVDSLFDRLLTVEGEENYRVTRASAVLTDDLSSPEKTDEAFALLYDTYLPSDTSPSTLRDRLDTFGKKDAASPDGIVIYVSSFADKEVITDGIAAYNAGADEKDRIEYTDYVALLMSSITTIIDAISYVLIAFVAISLVVSSIMIGIITYISVLERTKEIGILRAVGASKGNVSSVFNAETLTVGFVSGVLGILVSLFFIVIINLILYALTGLADLKAVLPLNGAAVLVLISMGLTLIAGLVPSALAAKKDPVVALRTE